MKYIITNKQLFDSIYKFIDKDLRNDNIQYQLGWNYDKDRIELNSFTFFGDKFQKNEQSDWYFEYVKKEYYEKLNDDKDDYIRIKWLDKAPVLDVFRNEWTNKMNSIFNEYWKPVFEKWFSENYPQFPVKTFIY